jgi:hypothetical protein
MERNGTGHGVFGFAKRDGGALKRALLASYMTEFPPRADPDLKERSRERERERAGASLV